MKTVSISVLALILFLMVGCGKDDKKGTTSPETQTITDLSTLTSAPDKRAFVGAKVEVPNARAQQVVGTYFFWAGDTHAAIPVVRGDKLRGPVTEHVRQGQTVRLSGTVRLLESVPAADPMWDHINERERADIMAVGVYILADTVQIVH